MLGDRYDVIACRDPSEARVAIPAHRPNVILWDVGLGDGRVAGSAILDSLQQDLRLANTATVAVTATVHGDGARTWLWQGFDAAITKPIIDKRELWRVVDDLCGTSSSARM
jgi:CheY-like chemotaxis protein